MTRIAIFAIGLALANAADAPERRFPAIACQTLVSLDLPGAVITSATQVAAAGATPAYCRVFATVAPETDIELRLPDGWHQRLLHAGGNGFDGTIPNLNFNAAHLQQGYALAASNGGHRDPTGGPTRFLNEPVLVEDFAHAAIGKTVQLAKTVIEIYYGERPRHTYFSGCSNGGRGALNAAAKYGNEYDGVIAGAPSRNVPGLVAAWARAAQQVPPPPAKLTTMYRAQVALCDSDDGLADGIVSNPATCRFEVESLRCSPGIDDSSCLTESEIQAVKTIRSDLQLMNGKTVYSRFGIGDPSKGFGVFMPLGPAGSPTASAFLGGGHLQYVVFDDPTYDLASFDLNRDLHDVRKVIDHVYDFSADTAPLARYLRSGKKMIVWQGTEDTALSHLDTVRSFELMVDRAGKEAKNARLYTLPGVQHCGGGPGADRVDMVSALRDWVENAVAPETLSAAKINAAGQVLFSRPVCEHPAYPHYLGGADPNAAAAFRCVLPDGHDGRKQDVLVGE